MLAHKSMREALRNLFKRQAFAYTGRVPAKLKAQGVTPEQFVKSIQPYATKAAPGGKLPEPGFVSRQAARIREAVGMKPARAPEWQKLVTQEGLSPSMAKVVARQRAGMGSIPAMAKELRKDPKEFAKKWWRYGGKSEAALAPLWMGLPLLEKGQTPEERKKALGESIGGTLGWVGASGLPIGVWLPASHAAGYIGKRLAGGGKKPPEVK
jgi:hypothetical protein